MNDDVAMGIAIDLSGEDLEIVDRHWAEWLYLLGNQPARHWPFPHILLAEAMPQPVYDILRNRLMPDSAYIKLEDLGRVSKGHYPQRSMLPAQNCDAFWMGVLHRVTSREFAKALMRPYTGRLRNGEWQVEAFLMRDKAGFSMGPHTDMPQRLLSALFYLPQERWINDMSSRPYVDCRTIDWGTSLYVPKERGRTSHGHEHCNREHFDRIASVPFLPNHGLTFVRTDNSFHGVDPVDCDADSVRDLLLVNIREVPKDVQPTD